MRVCIRRRKFTRTTSSTSTSRSSLFCRYTYKSHAQRNKHAHSLTHTAFLQVLVGKTLEQGLMEVLEEEELANLRAHQDEYDQIRAAELAEAQRMEAAETRRAQEKERRIKQVSSSSSSSSSSSVSSSPGCWRCLFLLLLLSYLFLFVDL